MIIKILDEFDLEKIIYSGQCFRPRKLGDGSYFFITGQYYLVIKQINDKEYEVSCTQSEWDNVWFEYFDLGLCYGDINDKIDRKDQFMLDSLVASKGIRVLKQDKWEMLISYIISQRKSIPSIKTSVERICKKYGQVLCNIEGEDIYSFPTPVQLSKATFDELSQCGLGYRVSYIMDASKKVALGELDLDYINSFDDDELFMKLKELYGVGDKVANCVCLFAYHRIGRVPIDTWISKVINNVYDGVNPFIRYGSFAGIMQQYVFYYVQSGKGII